jgi:hypothetical protein
MTQTQALAAEHGVLMRQIGGLQRRSSDLMRAFAVREDALLRENLRLRAELVLLRTRVLWGLGVAGILRRKPAVAVAERTTLDRHAREAQAVICQTGCVGHAHPWLDADGQCRRSGQVCERVDVAAPER